MRSWIAAASLALAFTVFAGSASAAACKDAKGKFIKCPPAAAATAAKPVAAAPAKPAATPAAAATTRCKDAKGKFIKCPPAAAPASATRCRDAKSGKFAKCGTPGAKPA
jgi:hypothetical protein